MEDWKIITIGLTLVSIGWNIANTVFTHHSNTSNKKRLVNLEEFRSRVRDPLEDVLRRGEGVVREASLLGRHLDFPGEFESLLVEKNKELMHHLSEIQDRLMDADESRFSNNFNWLDLYDPAEDQLMNHMNDVLNTDLDAESRTEALRHCKSSFRKFRKTITAKIETQVAELST